LVSLIIFVHQYQVEIIRINKAVLGIAAILLPLTKWFTHGHLILQWMILGVSFIGAANGLLLGLMATIVVVNLLIWVAAVGLGLTFLGLIIYFIVTLFQ